MNRDKRIIILGGLGFIGRNLFKLLVEEYKEVKILTEKIYQTDKDFHSSGISKHIIFGSILDKGFVDKTLADYDVVFSLAGSSGASDSIKDPYHDLDTNLKGHLNILEACRQHNPKALLIFPSTRLVYGKPEVNPVNEMHPLKPESIYAIHKLTTEHYYLLYQRLYGLQCVIFRISNPYGPYQRFGSNNYGILNWFIHKAIIGEEIRLYGEGTQKRDFIYIDDLVRLLKNCISKPAMAGKIYNVGYGQGISMKNAVETIRQVVADTRVSFIPWPEIDQKIETGDYISDISALKEDAEWTPQITFEEGVRKTIKFYEQESR